MVGQPGFFDLSDRYAALRAAGDPLERLASVVDFESFRGPLIVALRRSARGKGGQPRLDPVMMFKILVLQPLYSLSDEATEVQIKDRLSFQRFLGLGLDGRIPDATTVWLFREQLEGQGDRQALCPFRCDTDRSRLPDDARSDRRCECCACTEAAEHRGREGRHQAGQDPGALEGEACQDPAIGL